MNIDCVRESINLPLLRTGDHLVIQYTGAYNMTQWMQFITLRPKVVMIDPKGTTHIIRENEGLTAISDYEKIPDYLRDVK